MTQFRATLQGADWRGTGAIPLVTVQAVIKRLKSKPGYTIEEAAELLGKEMSWVEDRIRDGTVRLLRTRWDASRLYLSEPMLQRLRAAVGNHEPPVALGKDWLRLSEAAMEAGVTAATIVKWGNQGELARLHQTAGWRYPRDAVRSRARTYWQKARFHRATQPGWLQAEVRPGT